VKAFFSEEKKQKTFTTGSAHGMDHVTRTSRNTLKEKFFASFFQKRSASLPWPNPCSSKN
jgi:hypothetical protein